MTLTREQLAARLREARLDLGLTQAEVAERLDVRQSTISTIETGRRAVTSDELYQFSRIYRVPVWSLLASQELRSAAFPVTVVASARKLPLREEHNLDAYRNRLVIRAWQLGLITTGRAADLLGIDDIPEVRRRMAEIGAEIEVDDSELLGAAARKVVLGHLQQG